MAAAILEIRNVAKSFPSVRALQGVSLTLEPGRIQALVGENGAGKSTLIKILAGVLHADEGQVLIDRKSVV
jgi:rhamnose transport system ATP-binding protein